MQSYYVEMYVIYFVYMRVMFFFQDSINEETVELMSPYLDMDDYSVDSAKRVCGDVAGLAAWTTAMAVFYGINKEVLPLKVRLKEYYIIPYLNVVQGQHSIFFYI